MTVEAGIIEISDLLTCIQKRFSVLVKKMFHSQKYSEASVKYRGKILVLNVCMKINFFETISSQECCAQMLR